MATTSKYYVLTPSADNQDFLDFGLNYGGITTVGEFIQYYGSAKVDSVFIRPGMTYDLTSTAGGADKIYFTGSLADYTSVVSGNVLTLSRTVGGLSEVVSVSNGTSLAFDRLVFANGTVGAYALATAAAAHTPLPTPDLVETSLAPVGAAAPGATLEATVRAYSTSTATAGQVGATFASTRPGINLIVNGGAGIDTVYVADGETVDARVLGSSVDLVYMRGNWADYTKTLLPNGTELLLTRVINGVTESVKVTGGSTLNHDKLIFADGAVTTDNAKSAVLVNPTGPLSAVTGVDLNTKTPLYNDAEVATALGKIAAIAQGDSATATNPSLLDYTVAGVTGVTAANLGEINDALNSRPIDGLKADTTPEIQAIVNAYQAILNAADGSINTTLSGDTYASVGVTGVAPGAPVAGSALALLDSVVDQAHAADVNTVAELQAMADAAQHVMTAAGGTAAQALQLSAEDLGALGITGVTAANLWAVQSAVQGAADAAIDTKAHLQDLVNAAIASMTGALANIIYAAQNDKAASGDTATSHPALTVAAFNAASISGVTSANLGAINSALDSIPVTGLQADTQGEVQGIVDAYNAILDLADRQPDNATPLNSTPYTLVGVTGVSGTPIVGSVLHMLDSVVDASAAAAVDTTPELQAMANAAAHVMADIATPAGQTASVTAADLAALGIDIYAPANLAAVQAAIKASTDPVALDTQYELQTLVNAALGKTALNVLAVAAEGNTAASSGLNAASYTSAGITGVSDGATGNIASINSALDSFPVNGTRADTVAKVQALVDAYAVILSGANGTSGSPQITAEQYFAIGVTGVSGTPSVEGSALHLLDDVADLSARTAVDTTAEVQAMADAAARVMALTGDPSAALTPATSVSAQDLANLGITGVNASNLAAVQNALKLSTDAAVDTRQELQDLVNNTINNVVPAALAALQYAAFNNTATLGDATHSALTAAVYAAAGVTGVNASNLGAINSALDSDPVTDGLVNTAAEVQTIVNDYNAILSSADGLPNNNGPLRGDMFLAVGVTGVPTGVPTDGSALSLLSSAVDQSNTAAVDTVQELQAMADAAKHVIANVGATGAAGTTVADLLALGIAGVNASNLAAVQAALQALASPNAVDTQGELQRLVDGVLGSVGSALLTIAAAARDNDATAATPALSVYQAAAVTGVSAANLGSINSALDSALIGSDLADTTAEVQTIVDSYNAILASANGTANDTATPLSGLQYRNIGVTGVSGSATPGTALHLLNDVMDGKPQAAVDTVQELQALLDAATAVQALPAGTFGLTMAQLSMLGVTDASGGLLTNLVGTSQQAILNAIRGANSNGTATDTLAELQALVSQALTDQQHALTKLQDAAFANDAHSTLAIQDYLIAGLTGVTGTTILGAVNSALDSEYVTRSNVDSVAHAQIIVDDYIAILALADGHSNTATPTLTGEQYVAVGVTGISGTPTAGSALALLDDVVDRKTQSAVDTVQELQDLANASQAVQAQAAGTAGLTMAQLSLLGLTDRTGAALTGLSAAEQALVLSAIAVAADNGTATDTVGKIQALLNSYNHAPVITTPNVNPAVSGLFATGPNAVSSSPIDGSAVAGMVPQGWTITSLSPELNDYSNSDYAVSGYSLTNLTGTSLGGGNFVELLSQNGLGSEGMGTTLTGLTAGRTYVYALQWQQGTLFSQTLGNFSGGQLVVTINGHDQLYTSSGLADNWQTASYSFQATSTQATLNLRINGLVGISASAVGTYGGYIVVDSLSAAQINQLYPVLSNGAQVNAVFRATTDVDQNATLKGWAIDSAATSGSNHWQYSSNGGTTWINMDSASSSQAILLATTDLIRWTGLAGSNTTLSARAVDNTSADSLHTAIDVSTNGGITAYSGNEAQLASGVLGKLQIAARDNTATASLVMQDYLDAGLVGVNDATILRAVNSALDSDNVTDSQLDSNAHAQLIVDDYKAILTSANGSATPSATALTAAQYTTIGVTGVVGDGVGTTVHLLDDVVDVSNNAAVDTVLEIQALANAAQHVMDAAGGTPAQIAALTMADLTALGVTGLTVHNFPDILVALAAKADADVDTRAELQALAPVDHVAPTLVSSTPADNGTLAATSNLTLTFSENIYLGTTGTVTLKALSVGGSDVVIDLANLNGQLSVSGHTLTINPTNDLAYSKNYAVEISSGAIVDAANNAYAGIADTTTLNFTTQTAAVDLRNLVSSGQAATFTLPSPGTALFYSGAGDFNGDGYSDVLVTAGTATDYNDLVYVLFGSAQGLSSFASAASGIGGFVITEPSSQINQRGFGTHLTTLGDINGDGLDDIGISAYSNSGQTGGQSYVIYGKTDGSAINLNNIANGIGGFQITTVGLSNTQRFMALGDVNGDGYADYARYDSTATVYLGGPTGSALTSFTITGTSRQVLSISAVGDINGDGLADMAVGEWIVPALNSGVPMDTYIVYGKTGTGAVTFGPNNPSSGFRIYDSTVISIVSSRCIGDVNGDGYSDLLVNTDYANSRSSSAYVIFGGAIGADVDVSQLGSKGYKIYFDAFTNQTQIYGSTLGDSVTGVGDFNGDGISDFMVASNTPSATVGASILYIIYGKTGNAPISLLDITNSQTGGVAINQTVGTLNNGYAYHALGDINGDGFADIGMQTSTTQFVVIYGNATGAIGHTSVDQIGTDANDIFTSTGSQTLVGGLGNDTFIASGADVLYGGGGNDTFVIGASTATALQSLMGAGGNTTQLATINGGTGLDTLQFSGGASLDLTRVSNAAMNEIGINSRIESIERIDMRTDTGANTLTLAVKDVLDITGMNLINSITKASSDWNWTGGTYNFATTELNHQLVIDGTSVDKVITSGGFVDMGTAFMNGHNYEVYNQAASHVQLLIDQSINRTQVI